MGLSPSAPAEPVDLAPVVNDEVSVPELSGDQRAQLAEVREQAATDPKDSGTSWVDEASGQVVLAVPAGTDSAAGEQADATVRAAASLEEFDQILSGVYDVALPTGVQVYSAELDAAAQRVIVEVSQTSDQVRQAFFDAYGDLVALRVGEPVELTARHRDTSPFYGGNRVWAVTSYTDTTGDGCTGGFAWRTAANRASMVTAGHCAPQGVSDKYFSTYYNNAPYSLGVRTASTFVEGTGTVTYKGGLYGDLASVVIVSGKSSSGRIFLGSTTSTTSSPVKGLATRDPLEGDKVCISGATTGEMCGWTVTSARTTFSAAGGLKIRYTAKATRQGVCAQHGDSGAPVYTKTNAGITARGIYNGGGGGGSDNYGGALDKCTAFFTPISAAKRIFGGNIATQ